MGIVLGDISPEPLPSLQHQAVQSNYLFVRLFLYFTIFYCNAIICLKTLQGPLKSIILVNQIHKIVFTSVDLPRGAVLDYFFCPFLCIVTFLAFLYFFRTIHLLHITFSQMFLVLLIGLLN